MDPSDESRPPSSITSTTPKPSYRETFKRQKTNNDIDRELFTSLKYINEEYAQKTNSEEQMESPNMNFCKSLVPLLDKLGHEKNILARIKIQQIIYEIQYDKTL